MANEVPSKTAATAAVREAKRIANEEQWASLNTSPAERRIVESREELVLALMHAKNDFLIDDKFLEKGNLIVVIPGDVDEDTSSAHEKPDLMDLINRTTVLRDIRRFDFVLYCAPHPMPITADILDFTDVIYVSYDNGHEGTLHCTFLFRKVCSKCSANKKGFFREIESNYRQPDDRFVLNWNVHALHNLTNEKAVTASSADGAVNIDPFLISYEYELTR